MSQLPMEVHVFITAGESVPDSEVQFSTMFESA